MKEEDNPFYYKSRYNKSLKELYADFNHNLKSRIEKILSTTAIGKKFRDQFELYSFSQRKKIGKYNISPLTLNKENDFVYRNISLDEINFFEIIDIDDFDRYRKTIISRFAKNQVFFSTKTQDDIKETLSKIKINLDTISWGKLFSMNYSKKQTLKNDLISFASVSYIKTNESYFIIKIQVKPTEKFKSIFKQIINEKDTELSKVHYNSYLNILKTKHFVSYEAFVPSLKCFNIESLVYDVNYQVKQNITKYLQGNFHRSKISKFLPSIEYYEVDNIQEFHKDSNILQNFENSFDGYYSLEDNQVEIYLTNDRRKDQTLIQIVKQKGHGNRENSKNDFTDYSYIESHYLIESLAFTCFFTGILKEQFEKLNILKRNIYDFLKTSKSRNPIKNSLFFYYNRKYLRLKITLTEILLVTSRFETEFTQRNIHLYSKHTDLSKFTPRNQFNSYKEKNLLSRIIENFREQIKILNSKTKKTNEIFKTVEELNNYKTNYIIQVTSLLIAILALIFTFEKTKSLIIKVVEYIQQHCR